MADNGTIDLIPRAARNGCPRWQRLAAGAAALTLVLAACDGDDDTTDQIQQEIDEIGGDVEAAIEEFGEDSVEVAARNLASTFGADEFADAGHPIDGDLVCEADASDDLTAVEIDCSGATEDGSAAAVTGSTTELPGASLTELEGTFAGFVDNEEVFNTDALG